MMRFKPTSLRRTAAVLLCCGVAGLILAGCAAGRLDTAMGIARKGHLMRQGDLPAAPFMLARWQRATQPGAPVHVYIEGDGLAWLSRSTPSTDPTPKNPLALALAGVDPAANVVYLARPCQYTDRSAPEQSCARAYWTNKRFAAEVISSYNNALNQIAQETSSTGFHLIGYSGGANIAGLLAAQRDDILSLRSVAGNLDNDFFTQLHKVSAMPLSLNMADSAAKLANLPQYHFIAARDEFVPPAIFQSYAGKLGASYCLQSAIVPGTTHHDGWVARWPGLLARAPACR